MVATDLKVSLTMEDLSASSLNRFERNVSQVMASASGAGSKFGKVVSTITGSLSTLASVGLSAVVFGLYALVDNFIASRKEAEKFSAELQTISDLSGESATSLNLTVRFLKEVGVESQVAASMFEKVDESLQAAIASTNSMSATFKALNVDVEKAIKSGQEISDVMTQMAARAAEFAPSKNLWRGIAEIVGKENLAEFKKTMTPFLEIQGGQGTKVAEDPREILRRMKAEQKDIEETAKSINRLEAENKKILDSFLSPMEQINKKHQENLDILNSALEKHRITDDEYIKQRELEEQIYQKRVETYEQTQAQLAVDQMMTRVLEEQRVKLEQQNAEREKEAARQQNIRENLGFGANFELAAENMQEVNQLGNLGADTFTRLAHAGSDFNDVINQMADGTKRGKEAFHDMALGIIRDMQRLLIERGFMTIFASLFGAPQIPVAPVSGAAKGAVWQGGFSPIKKFSTGSPYVDRPTLGLIGEGRNAEAVVPLPDNRSIPVKMIGGNGQGGNTIHFNVSTDDADSFMRKKRQITQMLQEIVATNMPIRRQLKAL